MATAMNAPKYFPFDPHPRRPSEPPPPLACDCQFHLLGPEDKYPPRPGAAYVMPIATWEAAKRMHDALGIQRGIVVQPTTYGADHQVTLDGLAILGPNYKGCANAAVFGEKDDAYLATLHDAGVRGARFTRQGLGLALSKEAYAAAIARVKRLGWYAKFQPEPGGMMDQMWMIEDLEIPAILDHLGRADPAAVAADPTRRKIIELLKRGNFWVMISLVEKLSKSGPPWDDVIPLARAYLDAAPDRVIWASDWPHPVSTKQPPNEGDLMEFLYRVAPDPATRRQILVDNPARLFGFP